MAGKGEWVRPVEPIAVVVQVSVVLRASLCCPPDRRRAPPATWRSGAPRGSGRPFVLETTSSGGARRLARTKCRKGGGRARRGRGTYCVAGRLRRPSTWFGPFLFPEVQGRPLATLSVSRRSPQALRVSCCVRVTFRHLPPRCVCRRTLHIKRDAHGKL